MMMMCNNTYQAYADRTPHDDKGVLHRVRAGLCSVRFAAQLLDWTIDDVCMAVWGRVTL